MNRNVWLFQGNPKQYTENADDLFYDLEVRFSEMRAGDEDRWRVTRYRDLMQRGDRVLLWQSGPRAGIYAIGELLAPPQERKERDRGDETTTWIVRFRYTQILPQPLLKSELKEHPLLQDLHVIRQPQGTNFKVAPEEWASIQALLESAQLPDERYDEPTFEGIVSIIHRQGLRLEPSLLRRYHLALKTRGFVILSGISGTGKTWLTEAYAAATGAHHCLVAVAPNWNTNEDLLGYFNPLDGRYHDTTFSRFVRRAADEHHQAQAQGRPARPFHLVLDEMNLARVEYYFAKFLSAMEVRSRHGAAELEMGPDERVTVTPNLFFIGTVNVDETTHGFADKVYDRAQLIELQPPREALHAHLDGEPYQELLMEAWDALHPVAPFAFRVLDEIKTYVSEAQKLDVPWQEALDEQFVHKVLPKVKGTDPRAEETLRSLMRTTETFPLCQAKLQSMLHGFERHGFVSYF